MTGETVSHDVLFQFGEVGLVLSVWTPDPPGKLSQRTDLFRITTAMVAHHQMQAQLEPLKPSQLFGFPACDQS
jgi:hypothetical protein